MVDINKRRFLTTVIRLLSVGGLIAALRPFFSSLLPNAQIRAQTKPIKVDVSHLKPGERMMVVWRGQPIWIIRRTVEMCRQLEKINPELRDPKALVAQQPHFITAPFRSLVPEYFVVVGICTHLGCIPTYRPDDEIRPGFHCPCHGSVFDLSGRVYKDVPAPVNLKVPLYRMVDRQFIEIGVGP